MTGLLIGIPFIFIIGNSDSLHIVYSTLAIFGFSRSIYDSNLLAVLYDVIEVPYLATATGLILMVGFIAGTASPYILGIIRQLFGLAGGHAEY
jgi:hypothetical protein